jgi:MFS family permease
MSERSERGRRVGVLWRNSDFMRFWTGQSASLFGTQVSKLALPLTAILTLSATAGQLGLLRTAEFLPFLLISLPAGVWIDRRRRRPVMIAADLARMALIALVPLLAFPHLLRIWHLYAVALLVGLFTVLFDLSYLSYVPRVVGREHLVEANSKLMVSTSVAEIGGPGLGGLLVQLLTAPAALLVDAVSYLASALCVGRIRRPEPEPAVPERRPALRAEVGDGLRLVFGNRYLRAIAGEGFLFNFFLQFVETLFVLYAVRQLGFSPGLVGGVIGVGSIGGLLGSVVAARVAARMRFGPAVSLGCVVACAGPILLPLVTGPLWLAVALAVAAFFLLGFGSGVANVLNVSLRQTVTPDRSLGRMNASMRLALYGAIPLGALAGGFLGGAIGLRPTLFVAGAGFFVALLPIVLSPIPRLAELPPAADEQAEVPSAATAVPEPGASGG